MRDFLIAVAAGLTVIGIQVLAEEYYRGWVREQLGFDAGAVAGPGDLVAIARQVLGSR